MPSTYVSVDFILVGNLDTNVVDPCACFLLTKLEKKRQKVIEFNLPESPTFSGNFLRCQNLSFLGNFYRRLAIFFSSHCLIACE